MRQLNKEPAWYTIYDAYSSMDEIVCIGTKVMVSQALGITPRAFEDTLRNVKLGKSKAYIIVEEKDGKFKTYGEERKCRKTSS